MVKFKLLRRLSGVRVRVPDEGPYMKRVQAFTVGKNEVPAHWSHGQPIRVGGQIGSIIINRHFFVADEMLGRTIVARVEVVEKTTNDGRRFLLINFFPQPPETAVKREVKFIQVSDPEPEDSTHFFRVTANGKCGIYFHPCRD